jgi:hypothetical protein
MTWVRLDDTFAEHPKMEAAGPLGLALHVAALCYCARHLTDGFIPAAKVPRLLDMPTWRKVAARLVEVGAWDEVDDGYSLHDYLDFQPSRAEVEADRAKARDRMRRRRSGGSSPEHTENFGSSSPSPARPGPSRPPTGSLQQQQNPYEPPLAAAAEAVAQRRNLPALAQTKERPQRWLEASLRGIQNDLRQHPDFGRLVHQQATPEAFADLLEPPAFDPVLHRNEPDPNVPLRSVS